MSGFWQEYLLPSGLCGMAAALACVLLDAARARAGRRAAGLGGWGLALVLYWVPADLFVGGGGLFRQGLPTALNGAGGPVAGLPGAARGLCSGAVQLAVLSPASRLAAALPWLWLGGVAACAALRLWRGVRAARRLRRLRRPAEGCLAEAWPMAGTGRRPPAAVRVYFLEGLSAPFACGLLRPAVYLPPALDPGRGAPVRQTEAALRHELAHIRRGHLWLKAAAALCTLLHWFDPLAWQLQRRIDLGCELACDAAATRGMTPAQKQAYARLLLRFSAPAQPGGAGLSRGGRQLAVRIGALRRPAQSGGFGRAVLALLFCALCLPAAAGCAGAARQAARGAALLQSALAAPQRYLPRRSDLGEGPLASPEELVALGWPVPAWRYCSRKQAAGILIAAEPGSTITAAADGVVLAVSADGQTAIDPANGRTVVLVHSTCPDISTSYAHCGEILVQPGQLVAAGQPIGTVGTTGQINGPACRYQVQIDGQVYRPDRWYPGIV